MAQITVQKPVAILPGGPGAVSPINIPVHNGQTVLDADIVALNGDGISIQPAGANPAAITGIAQHAGTSVLTSGTTSRDVFGYFQGQPMTSTSNQGVIVVTLSGIPVRINLTANTGWVSGGAQQAVLGTRVGLAIDGTTGFYVADPTAGNKIATVVAKPGGPGSQVFGNVIGGPGGVGDLGAIVEILFDNSALTLPISG